MRNFHWMRFSLFFIVVFLFVSSIGQSQTIALWLFDEQVDIYPSCVLNTSSENDYPLVLGLGGKIKPGKFGNALSATEQPPIEIPDGEARFGLQQMPIPDDRTIPPLSWHNAHFCALMTSGENHLRKEVGFVHPTQTYLNIGDFDWTVEFWLMVTRDTGEDGVIFEIGTGPRGENEKVTSLMLNKSLDSFTLFNSEAKLVLNIPSDTKVFDPRKKDWHHVAFVYSKNENQLRHYVDGKLQLLPEQSEMKSLEAGEEDFMSVGRDGLWKRPFQGKIDELHFYDGQLYTAEFEPPTSYSPFSSKEKAEPELKKGLPLLFGPLAEQEQTIKLGSRKHLFIDDALIEKSSDIQFVVNPPELEERVVENIMGHYRKHLAVVEDEEGIIRIYNSVQDDYLQVMTSEDGIHFKYPYLGKAYRGHQNLVLKQPVGGLGNPFIDPNGSGEDKWKMITGHHRRGIFLYTSPDGYNWERMKTAVLPLRSGTQSCTFYDDQRQLYVGYHRTGFFHTPGGATQRGSSLTQVKNLYQPWPFNPVTQKETWEATDTLRLRQPQPWYLDNGPLTPGGFGLEYPYKFLPIDTLDPVGTDIYITKAQKYPWAPDAYFAFPIAYFHWYGDGPLTRQILMHPDRNMGSGPVETQIAVSRDGVHWKRYPRPAYVGIGKFQGWDIHSSYLAHGMLKRNQQIWQYVYGLQEYHSSYEKDDEHRGVFRLVQRIDGFISIDTPYHKEGLIVTKPLVFEGNRLILNVDTDAAGYVQVGFLDKKGNPIPGFSVDNCVYINGDFLNKEVEWIKNPEALQIPYGSSIKELAKQASEKLKITTDVSELEEKTIQLVFRMRGAKLYAMQFVSDNTN